MTQYNTGTKISNGNTGAGSENLTVPVGVKKGDVCWLIVTAWETASATETIQVGSTGTVPLIVGTTQNVSFSGSNHHGALFKFVASATDAGKVITASLLSANNAKWALAIVTYTGALGLDVSNVTTNSGNGSTITCPTVTTTVPGDWCLQLVSAALGGSAYTGGAGFTQRQSVSDPASGATAFAYDSNGSVGPNGINTGGAVFANAGNNSWWIGWTVAMSPAVSSGLLAGSFP